MQTSCSAETSPNCRLWIILLFPPDSWSSRWNNCAHRTHTFSPSQLWLTETSFSQAGGTSVFNSTPLLKNTENICRGSSYFLNVMLNAPQQSLHHLQCSIQCIFCRHSSLPETCAAFFFIWLSSHQNSISNIFLLVKTGSGLTRALTSVRVLSLCWEGNQAFSLLQVRC